MTSLNSLVKKLNLLILMISNTTPAIRGGLNAIGEIMKHLDKDFGEALNDVMKKAGRDKPTKPRFDDGVQPSHCIANVICAYAIFDKNGDIFFDSIRKDRKICWIDFCQPKSWELTYAKRIGGYKCKKIKISI